MNYRGAEGAQFRAENEEAAEDQEETYVVVPVLGGGYYSLFSDGSYAEWLPQDARPTWRGSDGGH
jgi:hypothetical protein